MHRLQLLILCKEKYKHCKKNVSNFNSVNSAEEKSYCLFKLSGNKLFYCIHFSENCSASKVPFPVNKMQGKKSVFIFLNDTNWTSFFAINLAAQAKCVTHVPII